eukprot:scaffold1427_cov63-Cylindrotheca_fusiformis.AAC.4
MSKPSPIIEIFSVPPLQCNCTIIGDPENNRDCIVVDPGGNVDYILQRISKHGLTLKRVLITHGHLDHIAGGKELKDKTGCDILMHQDDLGLYEKVKEQFRDFGMALQAPREPLPRPDEFVSDGTVLKWSPSYSIECIHCPGHTAGSIAYYFPECSMVCPGDTLFRGSVGRTSWYGIPSLEVSGHGEQTTIGEEQMNNPYVR